MSAGGGALEQLALFSSPHPKLLHGCTVEILLSGTHQSRGPVGCPSFLLSWVGGCSWGRRCKRTSCTPQIRHSSHFKQNCSGHVFQMYVCTFFYCSLPVHCSYQVAKHHPLDLQWPPTTVWGLVSPLPPIHIPQPTIVKAFRLGGRDCRGGLAA